MNRKRLYQNFLMTVCGLFFAMLASAGITQDAVTDGTSNTILLVVAANEAAVPWTAPQDLEVDFDNPLNKVVAPNSPGFQAVFCDGSVPFLSQLIDPNSLIALFTRAGGEVINLNMVR